VGLCRGLQGRRGSRSTSEDGVKGDTGGQKSFCMSMTRSAEVDGLIEDMVVKAVIGCEGCHERNGFGFLIKLPGLHHLRYLRHRPSFITTFQRPSHHFPLTSSPLFDLQQRPNTLPLIEFHSLTFCTGSTALVGYIFHEHGLSMHGLE
jgi:hypothetical protein